MKYFLIAGEASGDLHASNLMIELKKQDPQADFCFLGGDLMKSVGGMLVKHYREMAYMGIIPVILHARTILRNMKSCKEAIAGYRPDVVILVDYPGFNLKIAKFVKTELHIPVYYYISPKIWAWKKYRIHSIKRYIDRMFCILPFEKSFYDKLDYPVDYVGNPSVDAVALYHEHTLSDTFLADNRLPEKPILVLLAGSRRQEVKKNLPVMMDVASCHVDYQCVIAGAPGLDPDDYREYTEHWNIPVVFNQTYALLEHSSVALVTSGTATLETALFRVPQVVCYHFGGGKLINFIFRHFFHTPYISLVNLIAGREVVRELFGATFTYRHVADELGRILDDSAYRDQMLAGYEDVIRILGRPGASARTATLIIRSLTKEN